MPAELTEFRTLFNAFHHFAPADAVAVLRDAARAGQPIGLFEMLDRRPAALAGFAVVTPLAVAAATPFIRPFRWRRLALTYVLPLVPLTCWWDGVVSHLRTYTPDELRGLAAQVGVGGYRWEAAQVPVPGGASRLTYLLGWPEAGAAVR